MNEPVSAQELSDMVSHAIQPTSLPSDAVKYQKMSVIYGQMAKFGWAALMEGEAVNAGIPFRKYMTNLQNLIIELSNVGFVNKARELATDLAYIERRFGQLYLQTQETT